ncbi:MAG: type II 3-dehydroquinate dehydratase [Rhodobiaceae bacterium]|nr:type II 3-dehydroquinate dehydratase [Rhodobiaceae bacterium]|tara:strand:+ start:1209 stop:1643 length:435 start_codon:yes stop_codon:yes gene_type:complete
MKKKIYILNGPNLNLLGEREPEIYGRSSLKDIEKSLNKIAKTNNLEIVFEQSNHEGELIELIQTASKESKGIIINPAGYTHTSIAIYDALLSSKLPIIEVHLSNIYKRENFRHISYVSKAADGIISGLGVEGYIFALKALINKI